jgi:hypothetical protein
MPVSVYMYKYIGVSVEVALSSSVFIITPKFVYKAACSVQSFFALFVQKNVST